MVPDLLEILWYEIRFKAMIHTELNYNDVCAPAFIFVPVIIVITRKLRVGICNFST